MSGGEPQIHLVMMVVMMMTVMMVRRCESGVGAKQHQNGNQTGDFHANNPVFESGGRARTKPRDQVEFRA
jgi:hypothetical protein